MRTGMTKRGTVILVAVMVLCIAQQPQDTRGSQEPLELPQDHLPAAAKSEFAAGSRAFDDRNYPEARKHFEQVTRMAPEWARGWKALGVTLALQDEIEAAEAPLRKACKLSPAEPDACYYLARGFYARDKFAAALKVLQPLLARDPEPARIEEAIAQAKEGLGEFDEAEKWYRKAIQHDSRQHALGLGRFLLGQGRLTEALPWLQKAAQQEPRSGQAHFALGRAYLQTGDTERALSEFQQAARLEPQNEAAQHLLQKAQSRQATDQR